MNATLARYNSKLTQLLATRPVILQILRFGAIGVLNTALDFIILNYLTKSFGIESGLQLGMINVIGFSAAIIQSYIWNKAWAFTAGSASPLQNAWRLISVGGLGTISFLLVIIGAAAAVTNTYFLFILVVFLVAEILIWYAFALRLRSQDGEHVGKQFLEFLIVSIIGLIINSFIVAIVSGWLATPLESLINSDTIKNVAKILATGVSMIWNFLGYKLVVFRK